MNPETVKVICAGCGQVISVTRDMIETPMACAACAAPIEYASYEPLLPWLEDLERRRERQREQERRQKAIEKDQARAEREAERHRREHERLERKHNENVLRAKREIEKERARARRIAEEIRAQRAARAGLRISTTTSMFVAAFFVIVALGVGGFGVMTLSRCETVMHEIAALLLVVTATIMFFSAVIFGTMFDLASLLAVKLDAVADAVRERETREQ